MKNFIILFLLFFILSLNLFAQDRTFLVTGFSNGSSDLNELNQYTLSHIETLLQDENIDVVFYGLADKNEWSNTSKSFSAALNSGLRLNRAMAFRERFGRGLIQISHETFRGVKVVLKPATEVIQEIYNTKNVTEITEVTNVIESPYAIGFQVGYWTSNLFRDQNTNLRLDDVYHAPFISVILSYNDLDVVGKVGIFYRRSGHDQIGNSLGKKFGYVGLVYNLNDTFGLAGGVHRGWEFVIDNDVWRTRQSSVDVGVVVNIGKFEFNPMLNWSHHVELTPRFKEDWKPGFTLSAGFNIF